MRGGWRGRASFVCAIKKNKMRLPIWVQELAWKLVSDDFIAENVAWDDDLTDCKNQAKSLQLNNDILAEANKDLFSQVSTLQDEILDLKEKVLKNSVYEAFLDESGTRLNLVYTKRKAHYNNKDIEMNVCDFITGFETLANGQTERQIFTTVTVYVHDNYQSQGMPDYWQLPVETWALKMGDCEDSSCLKITRVKASVAIPQSVKDSYFVALGYYIRYDGRKEGHAFPVRMTEDFKWEVLEATTNGFKPVSPEEDYEIYYVFNENDAWRLKEGVLFGSPTGTKILKEFGVKEK